jgi:hypothetical protein
MDPADLRNRFAHHPPDEDKAAEHAALRAHTLDLATLFDEVVPDSRELSLAVHALEEALFWANAGLARMDSAGNRL